MPAAIYTRISNDKTGQEAGVTRQLDECRQLAAKLGISVVHELSDNDISATTGVRRPAFEKLTKLIQSGAVDTVITWHPDRLYRKLRDLVPLLDLAQESGLTITSVQAGDMDLASPSGRMVAAILGSVATNEGEAKIERMKAAYRQHSSNGEWHFSNRPYGFQRAADGSVVHVPAEADRVRRLFQMYYEEGVSRHALIRFMNEHHGGNAATGKPWALATMRDMLRNPRYAGHSTYKGEVVGVGKWDPIIDPDDFHRWIRGRVKGENRFTRSATSLGSGLVYCAQCQAKVYRKRRGDSDRFEYACSEGQHVSVAQHILDTRLRQEVVMALLQGPAVAIPTDDHGDTLESLQEALSDAQTQRSDLLALVHDRLASAADIRPQLTEIKDLEDLLNSRRDALVASSATAAMLVGVQLDFMTGAGIDVGDDWGKKIRSQASDLMGQLAKKFDSLSLPKQRELVTSLLDVKLASGRGAGRIQVSLRVALAHHEMTGTIR